MAFPKHVVDTYYENWPTELAVLGMRTSSVPVEKDDVVALGSYTPSFRERFEVGEVRDLSARLLGDISKALAAFPAGVMPRLSHCSWKATTILNQPARTLKDVLAVITRPDERIAFALGDPAMHEEGTQLHLRAFVDIPRWSEFRIFMKGRRIVGVSQYFTSARFLEIERKMPEIAEALIAFAGEFRQACHMETVVADVFLEIAPRGLVARLIELNPFLSRTDSCLYSWKNGGDFDGRLRYVGEGRQVFAVSPRDAALPA